MSGKPYIYDEVSYRLMHYKGTVYKFKIGFSSCRAGKNPTRRALTPSESDQVNRTIGILVHQKHRRTDLTNALRTADFLIRCSERPWKIGKKVGFRLRGKELATHEFMFVLNVEPKQRRVTVSNDDVTLRARPGTSHTDSQGEPLGGGAPPSCAAEKRQSSSQQDLKSCALEQGTSAEQFQKAGEESEPLQRQLRSSSKLQREVSPTEVQGISKPSPRMPRKNQKLSRNEKSPRQMQKGQEVSPRQVRKSPRLLPSERSPTQLQQNSAISPRQRRTTAKLSEHERSPRQARSCLEASPRRIHQNSKISPAKSSQSSSTKSPEKHRIPEVSPRVLRRSPRFRPARSDPNSPLKSPERYGSLVRFSPSPGKRGQRSHSVDCEDDKIAKRLRSDSAKLLTSDITATEKLLHPLDKEFVRREYEQEEIRLRNLAKPSTSSAERKVWLYSS